MTQKALFVFFAATLAVSTLASTVQADDRPAFGASPKNSEPKADARSKAQSENPQFAGQMSASEIKAARLARNEANRWSVAPSAGMGAYGSEQLGTGMIDGGMGYYGMPSMSVGMGLDEKIVPLPSGPQAEKMYRSVQHIDDSVDMIGIQIKEATLQIRKISEAAVEAQKIAQTLSGGDLAKHDREFTAPYRAQLQSLKDEKRELEEDRAELRRDLSNLLKNEKRSAGFIVMTSEERTAAQKKGFNCGEGEQSVKRPALISGQGQEFGCLTADGQLAKLTVPYLDQILSINSYERENGKLSKIVTRTIDGKVAQELSYSSGINKVKLFGPSGEELSSCEFNTNYTSTLGYGDGGNKSQKKVDR